MIIAVYAPHDPRDKRMLWDYLAHVINQWQGEVVIMGDFNEVRVKSDRFGTNFNVLGANIFNSFINSTGLEEVHLGGSAFTWCHKSATKMSKLDRFFVSNNLLNIFPHISGITLDRFLSDHRPILLRESAHDYGPVPFRFFHHWIHLEGFNDFVTSTWNSAPSVDSNGMRNLAGKLKFLKAHIKIWIKDNKSETVSTIANLKKELNQLDAVIDKGTGTEVEAEKRMEVLAALRNIDHIHSMDLAQKAKIKWSIEGDENSNFFHGILNKKRNQMNIRGITIDGVWKEQPNDVKQEFLSHFQDRFAKPSERRANIDMRFPKTISEDQSQDLEREVSKQEIKTAVWGCGTDKSPGPDGFSFGFYRHFWRFIEHGSGVTVIQAAAKLGCLVLKCPFYYLGTRVGGSMIRVQAWQEIVEKVKSRLSKWKSKNFLSIGGQVYTLLKSVLGYIPSFTFLFSKFLQSPNEPQLKFNSSKDAKSLLQAVEKKFGGNAATKKTQRNLLKQ
ncbi:RNA-directed DNA polymerase, eukaryota [Tanacetum coccineum]